MQATVVIKDVFNITGIGAVITVDVKHGILKKGMKLNVDSKTMTIKSMDKGHRQLNEVSSGMVAVALQNGDKRVLRELKGRTVTFTMQGNVPTQVPIRPHPSRPKGAFSFITDLFKK